MEGISRIALIVEYEGTRYHGSQLQANSPTIQGEMECALRKLSGETVRITAASRTDAGGHARGQVMSFKTKSAFPPQTWVKGLNFYLPQDIAVKAAYRVSLDFNVRRDAISREYHYHILNDRVRSPFMQRFAYLVPQPLDIEAMNYACQVLIGEHDFASFSSLQRDGTVRRVYMTEVSKKGDLVLFDMVANSFLPRQVRNTIGGLIRVGSGKITPETFWELAEMRRAGAVRPAAPAHGLCLMEIDYAAFPPSGGEDENL